jgi:glyoxylase-like metal-dependent hydrolase (beta-lactamase superfamily II)
VLIFRQLIDPQSSTYTYLLADSATREAILIDPVFEQVRRDTALIQELGLRLLYTIDTHVHADHVTGAWMLKRRTGSLIAISAASGAEGADRYLKHDARPYRWLHQPRARRRQRDVHRRLPADQRHGPNRFPARQRARDVPRNS